MHTAKSLIKESIELISLPDVYIRLRDVINDPNTSMADVAHVIAHDPAVTARLLKLVNSPFFGLAYKVDTMTRAINLLGTEEVHDLVLATVVVDSFSGFVNDSFNIYDFWYKSVYCAVTARLIAFYCDDLHTERPFIAGLLHNIGHLVMYQIIPDESYRCATQAQQAERKQHLVERDEMGFDYAEVGAELMKEWQFAESLQLMTRFQNDPGKVSDDLKIETAVLHMSNCITENVLAEKTLNDENLAIHPLCWDKTGLTLDLVPDIKKEVDNQVNMVMGLLFTHKKSA